MKIRIKISIAAMLMSFSIGVTAQESQMVEINRLINSGSYQQVIAELDKFQASDERVDVKKLRALSYLELGQYALAEQLYLAINEYDNGVDVSNNLGLTYLRKLQFVKAIKLFQDTIRRFPEDSGAYKNLGDAYLFLAQSTYKKGLDTNDQTGDLQLKFDTASALFEKRSVEILTEPTAAELTVFEEVVTQEVNPERLVKVINETDIRLDLPTNVAMQKAHGWRINKMLASWVNARNNDDKDAYFSHYESTEVALEPETEPCDDVRALEPAIQFTSGQLASVVFDEWSGPYSQRKRLFKEFALELVGSDWKITNEQVIHVY